MRNSATAAAFLFLLGWNVIAVGSKGGLGGVSSHDSSKGNRCWMALSNLPLDVFSFAALTDPSLPVMSSATMANFHLFLFFSSSSWMMTTSYPGPYLRSRPPPPPLPLRKGPGMDWSRVTKQNILLWEGSYWQAYCHSSNNSFGDFLRRRHVEIFEVLYFPFVSKFCYYK